MCCLRAGQGVDILSNNIHNIIKNSKQSCIFVNIVSMPNIRAESQSQSQSQSKDVGTEKLPPMRTATDVVHRIQHDLSIDKTLITVGYLDAYT